ncbi:hypothetical protein NMD99_05560 [Wolbachia endosymbiont of Listronotus oregonensis]|uniref:hypothetical protein n=1 Tax=Wolbachia endosymbiont of Listronotus oregonensis TaxID=2969106 RepID=UPI002814ADEF|nr:hypothetical protein [Wolbachia endosymbiont of Listronotus oregonensis]WMT84102.1 hypothetical protein NMD99_05560 [Wolbachia endosymbiont of Listronotus oregonensis]
MRTSCVKIVLYKQKRKIVATTTDKKHERKEKGGLPFFLLLFFNLTVQLNTPDKSVILTSINHTN